MVPEADPAALIGRRADERLLEQDRSALPQSLRPPEPLPPSSARSRIVGTGAALTGVTLVAGVALVLVGAIGVLSSGLTFASAVALGVGAVLVATHWGWVHVAEVSADAVEHRRHRPLEVRQLAWLSGIEPYTRWSVLTETGEDGGLTILTLRHRPVALGEDSFTFEREISGREHHAAGEPAAAVAERAELLRRLAAADSEREHERYQAAVDHRDRATLVDRDEQERQAAARAGSQALSEQINTHLRQPPLED